MREERDEPTRPALALRLLPPATFLLLLLPLRFVAVGAVERELDADLDDRARTLAAGLAAAAREPLAAGPGESGEHDAQALLRNLLAPETALAWGAVLLEDGRTPLGVERAGARTPDLTGATENGLFHDGAGLVHVRLPVRGRVAVADLQAAGLPAERLLGYVHVALSRDDVERRVGAVARVLDAGLVLGALLLLGLAWAFTGRWVTRPLETAALAARALAAGDLTAVPAEDGDPLSGSLHRLGSSLRDTLGQLRGVAEGLAGVIARMSRTGERVTTGARATRAAAEATSASLVEITGSLGGIAENVEVLARAAEESSASILTMAATNDEVAGNVRALAGSVEETTTAIERMARAIQEVARSVEELSATAEGTSASMRDMDVAIVQVETNASETARLSEQVSTDAATGMVALQKTLTGIDNIKESSRTAADVIESLGRRIGSIGNVLNVIDDVAEQTNLLALNAAIIAAQAGEHGKGFAVVADEIKDLAERTGASTKEIAELIRSVQNESKNAISAMDRGVRSVEEGVRLGGEAESALRKIQDSAAKSTQMIKAIARATVEQSRGSRQVTSSITRIAETVQQIAASTGEQARGSEQIMKSAERMRQITGAVTRSSDEQARGSRQITRSIESISEMVNQLQRAQGEQMRGSERAQQSATGMRGVAEELLASVQELEAAIEALSGQADVLRAGLGRFRT